MYKGRRWFVGLWLVAAFVSALVLGHSNRATACALIYGPPYAPGYFDYHCEEWYDGYCPLLLCKEDWCTNTFGQCSSTPQYCTAWWSSCLGTLPACFQSCS